MPRVVGATMGTKRWRHILMRCHFKHIIMAAGVLSYDAKYKVRSLGFGYLLGLTLESLQNRERIIWLAERCDISSVGERFIVKINPGKSLEITPELAHDVLGIPRGCGDNNCRPLGSKLTAKEKKNEYRKLCNEMREAGFVVDFANKPRNKDGKKPPKEKETTKIKLDIFIQYMEGIRDVDKQVKCFFCILMNQLLLPTTSDYIIGENIAFCSDLERMENQDWCKIVCQRLKDGISEWMRKKGKENASDAVPTGCTAVLLISYLDSLLPEPEQEKPRIIHYNKEKLVKMIAQADEKDKMGKHKDDKKEKCTQKMYDNPKHKELEHDIVAQIPSLKHLLKPCLENVPDILRDEINTTVENHQTCHLHALNAVCEVCGDIGVERLLLCCSDCKGAHTHQYCLEKVLYDAPFEGWSCDECSQRHNEGSHSRCLGKVSSERPSNHARSDSTSQQPITKRLESATVVGPWGQQKSKSTVVGANIKKKNSSREKSMQKKCIRNKSNMRFKQPTPVIVIALGYKLGDTSQSHVLKQYEGLARKSMQAPQSPRMDQVYSTTFLEISSKATFALEASATEVEISDTAQNLRKDSPKKHRHLILTGDDEDEERAEDVHPESVNHQRLMCNESMVKHRINTKYCVEEAVQTGDLNDQNLINSRPMKRRRRYIGESEDEEDMEGPGSALNNASKCSLNDSANMASQTPVATDHSLHSRPSDSEYANQQYHICLQPLDGPVWSGVFKIDNEVFLKLDAHLSNKASQRVHELSGLLQPVVEVTTLSRLQAWPERWISSGPTDESIGLFFLPHSSTQNEELTRLSRIIKSDDALQVTVGTVELLIFPSVLLPKQYHLFQGKHYLWGVFRQRKDILDNGVDDEEQDGSAHATEEGQHQEHGLLNQQDEALYELSDKENFAVKHVGDSEDQLQVEGDPEGTKRWSKILMRCNFKNIIMAAGVLSDDAKYKVRSLGFGDLLGLTLESLQGRERIIWLAERCNVSSVGERFIMKINPGKSLEITPELVHDVLGIPRGCGENNNRPLGSKLTAKEKRNDYRKLCNEMREAGFVVDFANKPRNKDGKKKPPKEKETTKIKLDIFIQYMEGIRDVDKQVKCFFCILMNQLLLPTTSDYIIGENIAFCSDLESMEKQDWCKIVCQRLKDGISDWMRKKGKENASDAVPTGCTAVLLISYLDSLLPVPEPEKPRIKHYNKEKLLKMLAQAKEQDRIGKRKKDTIENEKDKTEKRRKDKKEKGKQNMHDSPKHKESSEQDMVAQIPSLKHLLKPFLENVPDTLRDEINTAVENHQTKINTALENHQTKMFQEMSRLQSEAVAEIKKIVGNCNVMSAMSGE